MVNIRAHSISVQEGEKFRIGGSPSRGTESHCASECIQIAYPNTGLLAELVALRIAEVVVRVEARVQRRYQVEQGLSRDCITKVSTFSVFVTVTEAFAGAVE